MSPRRILAALLVVWLPAACGPAAAPPDAGLPGDGAPADVLPGDPVAPDGQVPDGGADLSPADLPAPDGAPADAAPPDGGPPDAPPPDYPPSTANVGWIGGACASDGDCTNPGGRCLRDARFPNGMCTAPCARFCDDRGEPGDTLSFCADAYPYALEAPLDLGLCVARCDRELLPPTGCPAGYRCVPRNRFAEPRTVVEVCVPLAERAPSCDGASDEIITVDYPDRGALFVPAEAQCGGSFDLVVMLHGINPNSTEMPSLGGGRHQELLARALIDHRRVEPLLVAEPVHFEGGSTTLYGAEFSLTEHLDLLAPHLQARGITLRSLSYVGHSGAGCDPDGGLYKVLAELETIVPAYAPSLRLWGLEDICYGPGYHYMAPAATLGGTGTVIVNVYTGQGDPTSFEAGLFPEPLPLDCNTQLYSSCITRADEPWCSYRTRASAGINHDNNPYFFFREVLPQVFGATPSPCGR